MTKHAAHPKNVVISHVYSSENKGDAALTSVLIKDIRRVFKGAHITILKLDAGGNGVFEGVPEQQSFMSHALNRYKNPVTKLAYALYMMTVTLLWAAGRRYADAHLQVPKHLRTALQLYEQADIIVPVGGGYLRSRPGLKHCFNVPLLLHPLLLGYILGKPTVLYSQSVGPFQNGFEKALVAFVLKRMTCVMLREDTSVALLANMGVKHNVVRAVDSGFLLKSKGKADLRRMYDIPPSDLLVGVTVREWLAGNAQEKYEAAVAKALDDLVETTGAHVVFIPQVTAAKGDDDRLVSKRVHGLMRRADSATLITDTPDHHTIKALYDNLDVLLGTRFHSVIFSLTSHVPVLAIEYEHKTSGIMRDVGLQQWVMKIEDVDHPTLTSRLRALVNGRVAYREYLGRRMPPYVQQAGRAADILKESYERAAA